MADRACKRDGCGPRGHAKTMQATLTRTTWLAEESAARCCHPRNASERKGRPYWVPRHAEQQGPQWKQHGAKPSSSINTAEEPENKQARRRQAVLHKAGFNHLTAEGLTGIPLLPPRRRTQRARAWRHESHPRPR